MSALFVLYNIYVPCHSYLRNVYFCGQTQKTMRNICLFATIILWALSSCVNEIHPDMEDENSQVNLRISAYAVSSLTRAALSDGAKWVSWAIVGSDGETVCQADQYVEDTGFGTLTAPLDYGTYTLYTVAHSQSVSCSLSKEGMATFGETKITDTFCRARTFTLEKDGKDTLHIYMPRAVAKFTMRCTDAIPGNADYLTFSFRPAGSVLNVATGLAAADTQTEQKRIIVIPAANLGKANASFSFYTFLPADEATLTVTATCYDESDAKLYEHTFTSVPLQINHQTTYTGEFFKVGTDIGGTLYVINEWGDEKIFEF